MLEYYYACDCYEFEYKQQQYLATVVCIMSEYACLVSHAELHVFNR